MSSNLTAAELNAAPEKPVQRATFESLFWVYDRKPFVIPNQQIRTLRVPGVSRNARCPCGSGAKFYKCCRVHNRKTIVRDGIETTAPPERFNGPFRGCRGRPW